MSHRLHVIAYHYVRDLPNTAFPAIKGILTSDFRIQVDQLRSRYEMASLETALAFLGGQYRPSRDLCLLTFDDGLKEHYAEVTPILVDLHVQGLFFLITSCPEERRVVPVHMSHFLMASLGFDRYRSFFTETLDDLAPGLRAASPVDPALAQRTYRWDPPDVASFKYLLNFGLDWDVRDRVVRILFEGHVSFEAPFSDSLYLTWDEARAMQTAGMIVGGHSHQHKPLARLEEDELDRDLTQCRDLLARHLGIRKPQPFCYPYGKTNAFNRTVAGTLSRLGFDCAFTTVVGFNEPGSDKFALQRIDCNDVTAGRV